MNKSTWVNDINSTALNNSLEELFTFCRMTYKNGKGSDYMSSWPKEEISGQYNHAKCPWYSIDTNGKVDIGKENGDNEKISLEVKGMFRLVKDWLEQMNERHLSKEEREELIKLLKPKTRDWKGVSS